MLHIDGRERGGKLKQMDTSPTTHWVSEESRILIILWFISLVCFNANTERKFSDASGVIMRKTLIQSNSKSLLIPQLQFDCNPPQGVHTEAAKEANGSQLRLL